jgi:cellulose synthase operon protein C
LLILWIAAVIVTPQGLSIPDRLTAGPANQYLGAQAPDGRELYFASDEESTTQIYLQDLTTGIPQLAFDELADVTWPRVSPDGSHLLYISYREDAAGDLCVRDILGRPGNRKLGPRRCVTGPESAELQAVWFPDGRSMAVVTRPGLHGDFELRRVTLDGKLGERLTAGSVTSPALSPDGRWVIAVPVQRGSRDVGPSFLGRSTGGLELVALSSASASAPLRIPFDLPGTSAMPAFSLDGKWLYFSQFLNDTNLDGDIDGNDHGVLFRAPFADGKVGAPEQLSSARWSCQYPVPAADRLIATCLQAGSLDVFSLPLTGAMPPQWSVSPTQLAERIDDELASSRDRWERLLLLAHRGDTPAVQREMIRLHLELGEYESATFYAARLERSDVAAGAVLRELAEQRKAERSLGRGALSAPFVTAAQARLQRLASITHPLSIVARSEILDTLGQEDAARSVLTGLDVSDPLVAALYADRLLALYRDDPRYFELFRPVAEDNLGHAETFVRELLRGAARSKRTEIVESWLRRVDPYSDLAFLLELERALADLSAESQEQVRERVFLLYRKNKDLARRKALVGATLRRALDIDNDYLLYNFANSWVSYVPRERAERRRAERLYQDAVFERAYVEAARGAHADARGYFYGVTLQSESLEAHAGFIEMRLAEGNDPAKDYPGQFSDVVNGYVRAYLGARRLPELAGRADASEHRRVADAAIAELSAISRQAPQRSEVHLLWGYVAHQRFLRTGDRLAAVEANAHALIALDLARDNARTRAAVLDSLGRLQSSVGNYGIALGWLEQRAKLPFTSPLAQLSHCLALARARYHTSDSLGAATDGDRCLELTKAGDLARFRPVALDRSALYHLAAAQPEPAAARYAELWPLVDSSARAGVVAGDGKEAARNRLTTRLGQAGAALALGKAKETLEFVTAAERLLGAGTPAPRVGAYARERPDQPLSAQSYSLLLLGLRAQAYMLAGDVVAASRTLGARRDALARRLDASELDEDRLELALCEAQLAQLARRRKAPIGEALKHLSAARKLWTQWSSNTGTAIEDTGMAIVASFAELHLLAGVPISQLGFDLVSELTAGYTQLSSLRNPAWEPMRARFEVYLTTMKLRSAKQ